MRTASSLDKEITRSLSLLNTKQKETVLTVVKTFAEEEQEWWNDKKFIAEMDKRFKELATGKDKGLTLEELEASARQAYKNKNRKKK